MPKISRRWSRRARAEDPTGVSGDEEVQIVMPLGEDLAKPVQWIQARRSAVGVGWCFPGAYLYRVTQTAGR